jgi:hypothetical protein
MIHFIWLTEAGKGRPFSFINMLAVKAAAQFYSGKIWMWCNEEPKNNSNWMSIRHLVKIVKVNPPEHIDDVPLNYIQYKSDILRLQIIFEHGGIYLDTDHLLLKPLDSLIGKQLVLARESSGSYAMSPIIAEPGSEFIKAWLKEIPEEIKKGIWASHAVVLPVKIAEKYECDVRPREEFFPFDLKDYYLFDESKVNEYEKHMKGVYGVHIYETFWQGYLEHINEIYVKNSDTLFAKLFRHLV